MLAILSAILGMLMMVLNMVHYCLIVYLVVHWLIYFDILNSRNAFVSKVYEFLARLYEPLFYQIRRVVKPFNGIDLSAIILLLIIWFLQLLLLSLGANMMLSAVK